jgi:hypothetical protein
MKTLLFTFTILIGALMVRAQEKATKPDNKPAENPYRSLTITKNVPASSLNGTFKADTGKKNTYTFYPSSPLAMVQKSNMPVAKLANTDLKMPITQTDRTGYTMPVAGKSLSRIYTMPKPAAALPVVNP